MEALILCAGRSTRFRNKKFKDTKLLSTYKKDSLLNFHINKCINSGFKKLFFNVYFQKKKIEKVVKNIKELNYHISREKKLLGTSGALKKIKDKINDNIFVIYPDNISNCDYESMLKFHKKKKSDFTIATYLEKNIEKSGVINFNRSKKIYEILEKKRGQKKIKKWCNAGIYIISKKVYKEISKNEKDFAKDLIPKLINKKYKLFAFQIDKLLTFDTMALYKLNSKKNVS